MPTHYPMAIEPGSRYPAWPWQTTQRTGAGKSPLSGAARLWKAFKRERQGKHEVAILATWTSQGNLERSNAKRHTRSSSRNPLNLTVRTCSGPIVKQGTKDISPSSSTGRSKTQPSVFDSPPPSPADSATTYEPASSTEDLIVTGPVKFQFSDPDTDTEFWYDGILPEDRSFPGAYDDSPFVRPFTPAEGLTPDVSFKDFPTPPSLLPYVRPAHPEPRGSFRSSSQSRRSSTLRAAVLRKSRSYDSQVVNSILGFDASMQRRESKLRLPPTVPSLKPPKPLRFSKRVSNQSQTPSGRFGYTTGTNVPRNSGYQGKRESDYPPSSFTNHTSRRGSCSTQQESQLMRHILSTLQVQEDWEQDGDTIREHFSRKPTLAKSSGAGPSSQSGYTNDAMTARKRLLARLQGTGRRISGGMDMTTDTDADVEDLFSVCAGHFRSVVSAALSVDSSVGGRDSRSLLIGRGSPTLREEKVQMSSEREHEQEERVDGLQWCEVIDLGEYFVGGDRT